MLFLLSLSAVGFYLCSVMYYVVYGFLYLLSLLPLRVLFLFSDLAYLLLYYVIRYRKKVVMHNLSIAFPTKTESEKLAIAKAFYQNFTDNFIETIKLLSASKKFINKHFTSDYSIFEQLNAQGRKCQVHLGHYFNWELANVAVASSIPQKMLTVYMPVENETFDRLFLKLRSVTGAVLLPATNMRQTILPWRHTVYLLALVADQNPAWPGNAYWVRFFGRPTPFLRAPENGARIANLPVIFCYYTKPRRGYYHCVFEMGEENPKDLPKGELTRKYAQYLEAYITRHPELYLWSHRRWKWEWKEEYGPVID